jgi:hypothetical protein
MSRDSVGDTPHMTWWERLKYAMVRPDDEDDAKPAADERTVEELQEAIRHANDKERAIGLIAAPMGALLSFLIIDALVKNDPPVGSKNYVNPSLYHSLLFVLLGLAVLALVTALWRKRLFLGMALALFGLAVFNLHYWGFGVPFVMVGAWYMVRAYRLQQALKRAEANGPAPRTPLTKGGGSPGPRARASKRYTRPT